MEQVMQQDLSERIRERAYEIWIASGHRDGESTSTLAGRRARNVVQPALCGRDEGSGKADQRPGNG